MRILLLGDVVARPGRQILKDALPRLRETLTPDLVIANGENAAGGIGLSVPTLRELHEAGVTIVTSGNHIWRHRDIYASLDSDERLLRPANMAPQSPGRGCVIHTLADGRKAAVINIIGRSFMDAADCPFRVVDAILTGLPTDVTLRFIDFHAEATSEKRAMGFFVDGRATVLAGTHTHVQTADAMILPGGTGYLTDLGMCGAEKISVLGMNSTAIVQRFVSGLPERFTAAHGEGSINGLLVDADDATGKACALTLVRHSPAPCIAL